jgi:hypothetical protein
VSGLVAVVGYFTKKALEKLQEGQERIASTLSAQGERLARIEGKAG